MSLRINDVAPDFTVETTEGAIRFHEWTGDGDTSEGRTAVSNEQAREKFPDGWEAPKSCLRIVPQPE